MYAKVKTVTLLGLEGTLVNVEADIVRNIPKLTIVGLADTAVKESGERVRSAITNSGYSFPNERVTVNLAPAAIKKDGSALDLAIAMSLLCANDEVDEDPKDIIFIGELALDGSINSVKGVLPMVISMREEGFTKFIVPYANRNECSVVSDIEIYPAKNLTEVVEFVKGTGTLKRMVGNRSEEEVTYDLDFKDLKGQEKVKRLFEISAASRTNVLMVGTPGSGKTMAAKRFPTILPKLSFEEAIEVSKIYSVSGLLKEGALITTPPFRSPHHTASAVSLIGGGSIPKPGEISLAHRGVLFLDELPEFQKNVLEVLREPLESKTIHISRATATLTYPANFILIAALNPCPCGYHGSKLHECNCTRPQIDRYLSKVSHPLLDRIDMHIEVSEVNYEDISDEASGLDSETLRNSVLRARQLQEERYTKESFKLNGDLPDNKIRKYCKLDSACEKLMALSFKKYGFSARTYNKILKIARTIADLDSSENIKEMHLLEAIRYRTIDGKYWSK